MGKFFEALKKSQASNHRPSVQSASKKVVKISAQRIDALKLDTTAAEGQLQESPFPLNGIAPRLVACLEPGSPAAESFKMLRAKILTTDSKTRLRTIMVTSPQPLDGKTTVATNLAISIAQGINEYVILVDCDLRKPSVTAVFGLNGDGGVREYLEEGTSVAPYLIKTPVKKLTLLPAGKSPPNPSELLSSEKMRRLIEELKSRYEDRYVIFDAAPAHFAAETAFLAPMMDGVLLVVRSGKTAKQSILEALKNIDRSKILGVVFNASNETHKGYGYYYRYYQKGKK